MVVFFIDVRVFNIHFYNKMNKIKIKIKNVWFSLLEVSPVAYFKTAFEIK